MAFCDHHCKKDLGEPVKIDAERKYYICAACNHRVSTDNSFNWYSHGKQPFDFEKQDIDKFDFGFDVSQFDFGF